MCEFKLNFGEAIDMMKRGHFVCRESGRLVVRFRGFTKDAIPETVRSLVDEGRIFYKMPDPISK